MSSGFGGNTFGSPQTSAFGQPQPTLGSNGTAIAKYQPHSGTDTLVKNGQTNSVSTRQHCITAMKDYEAKCLEELRLEDYMANRKGPQAGAVTQSAGLFGASSPSTGLFGAPASQPQSTGLFGQQTTANTMGGFAQNTNNSFGQPSAFGQTQPAAPTGLFGKTNTGFGQATSTFGQTQAAAPGNLFGKPFTAVATSANTGFPGFGQFFKQFSLENFKIHLQILNNQAQILQSMRRVHSVQQNHLVKLQQEVCLGKQRQYQRRHLGSSRMHSDLLAMLHRQRQASQLHCLQTLAVLYSMV